MEDLARSPTALSHRIRTRALEAGFDAVGIAPLRLSDHAAAYRRWIDSGYAGTMGYLGREDAIAKRIDPSLVVPGARSAVVVAVHYATEGDEAGTAPSRGVFARYARNDDYHELLKPRLIDLQDWINRELVPVGGRAYVDTGPVLERELAARAGLGWFGKNTMLIRPQSGSYFFLGVVLLDVELEYDPEFTDEFCGTCTRCLGACPTDALLGRDAAGAALMDARRCISYLTIELKGPIPRPLRPLIGNRIYGCDICQEVCPYNRSKFVQITKEPAFWPRPGVHGEELVELMALSQEDFSKRFKKSPVKRAKRRGLLRNVAIGLGNWGSPEAVPVLISALADAEPLIRGHAAWALGQIASSDRCPADVVLQTSAALSGVLAGEADEWVHEEIELALSVVAGSGRSPPAGG